MKGHQPTGPKLEAAPVGPPTGSAAQRFTTMNPDQRRRFDGVPFIRGAYYEQLTTTNGVVIYQPRWPARLQKWGHDGWASFVEFDTDRRIVSHARVYCADVIAFREFAANEVIVLAEARFDAMKRQTSVARGTAVAHVTANELFGVKWLLKQLRGPEPDDDQKVIKQGHA